MARLTWRERHTEVYRMTMVSGVEIYHGVGSIKGAPWYTRLYGMVILAWARGIIRFHCLRKAASNPNHRQAMLTRMAALTRAPRHSFGDRAPRLDGLHWLEIFTSATWKAVKTRLLCAGRLTRMGSLPLLSVPIMAGWANRATFLRRLTWIYVADRRTIVTRNTSLSSTTILPIPN